MSLWNKKLEKFWGLDFADFLSELTKQKLAISATQKRNLLELFQQGQTKVNDLETKIDQVDEGIEEKVRGLYGVGS